METNQFKTITDKFPVTKKMPVLFTSHGNPMEALSDLNATPFFTSLGQVSKKIRDEYAKIKKKAVKYADGDGQKYRDYKEQCIKKLMKRALKVSNQKK